MAQRPSRNAAKKAVPKKSNLKNAKPSKDKVGSTELERTGQKSSAILETESEAPSTLPVSGVKAGSVAAPVKGKRGRKKGTKNKPKENSPVPEVRTEEPISISPADQAEQPATAERANGQFDPVAIISSWHLDYFTGTALKLIFEANRSSDPVAKLQEANVYLNQRIEQIQQM
ncbi:MAG TPA: hypothetical protein VEA58_07305 [Anaerovoracaceae bacterium]|nr:hypothetical protein [Anaerovoracaceae bacterium]